MKEFKPTCIYIKTHNTTGLNYLGKTCEKDPDKYEGSGVRWQHHIKKHGYDVTTFVIGRYTDEEECRRMAIFLSWFYNIIQSDDWANLKDETLDGGGGPRSDETKEKIRLAALARSTAGTHPLSKRADGTSVGQETMAARIKAGFLNPFSIREDGSSVASDRYASKSHPFQSKVGCLYCHKVVDLGNFLRWHGDECKQKPTETQIQEW